MKTKHPLDDNLHLLLRVQELAAENERLRDDFDSLYFFAEQALSGVNFESNTVLAFLPLLILKQQLEQCRGKAEAIEQEQPQ